MLCCSKLRCCRVPVTLVILVIYFCYLLLGAAVFWALENEAEQDQTLNFQQEKWELLRNHTCMDDKTLDMFIRGIIQAYKNGIPLLGNDTSADRWDFTGSFFFSVTAITTIGYGNVSPSTAGGRIFCIFFALFGIPLNLILLNRLGRRMLRLVQRAAEFLGRKTRRQKTVKFLSSTCALVSGLLLFFLLPPILFRAMEGWTYEEGFYYAFITLSTIGFGDYVIGQVPEKNYPNWYRNVVSLWILFGLAWLSLIINLSINLLESSPDFCLCCKRKVEEKRDLELIEVTLNGRAPTPLQGPEDSESTSSTSKADSLE
ncbi:potassium channel subfamily K member 17 [Hyla sarda]|uniref:potassium channel subfamily K member 17 n=1 Tax=Hyla sarda TaxID=327740 RepID=UPI0024C2C933|nr:potassium channel subfamily K member 17 [Hyla sarda]XP_056424617.1 potassium channel subfamily K member 17 [Hyla sarda]